jgi:hypothetical protein
MPALWGFEKVGCAQRCGENFRLKINPAFYRYSHIAGEADSSFNVD